MGDRGARHARRLGARGADAQAPAVVRAALRRDAGADHAHRARRRRRHASLRVRREGPVRHAQPRRILRARSRSKRKLSDAHTRRARRRSALRRLHRREGPPQPAVLAPARVRAPVPPHTGGPAQEIRIQPGYQGAEPRRRSRDSRRYLIHSGSLRVRLEGARGEATGDRVPSRGARREGGIRGGGEGGAAHGEGAGRRAQGNRPRLTPVHGPARNLRRRGRIRNRVRG